MAEQWRVYIHPEYDFEAEADRYYEAIMADAKKSA